MINRRTLTTPVPLIKCLKSIRDYAFASSPYPVIITLEDHLTPELQAKVAEVSFQFIFKDLNFQLLCFLFIYNPPIPLHVDGYSDIWRNAVLS